MWEKLCDICNIGNDLILIQQKAERDNSLDMILVILTYGTET